MVEEVFGVGGHDSDLVEEEEGPVVVAEEEEDFGGHEEGGAESADVEGVEAELDEAGELGVEERVLGVADVVENVGDVAGEVGKEGGLVRGHDRLGSGVVGELPLGALPLGLLGRLHAGTVVKVVDGGALLMRSGHAGEGPAPGAELNAELVLAEKRGVEVLGDRRVRRLARDVILPFHRNHYYNSRVDN